ncbi:hypothetical protein Q760_12475 [Cellulomonas cellasea DSM 20118]|uniref:Histidine kinase/HSP90-like ATPase domain-containing protein n=1 Tax=Cellulomonas cellasea DSM 20118 TaxID=1408250 RepID=A0A0A0BBD0_9CELL|nr:ATP-binding protein [Cellulomonas cellasea]KGM02616.1 hypothetical protein Q760_12475 [Cellulomonas cellasea DSM 20118]
MRSGADQDVPSSTPPQTFTTVGRWSLESASELAHVRHAIHDALTTLGTGVPDQVADQIVLVTSELATNALRHGIPPAVVNLGVDGTALLLDVADHHPGRAPVLAGERAVGAGGFGLMITQRLAADVGWYTTRTAKHVWATFRTMPPVP